MAFPAIATTATTNGTTATTSAVVTMPSGLAAGDLIIVVFRAAADGNVTPAGWTEFLESNADASDDGTTFLWRKATGDANDTLTMTITSSKFAAAAYRITGAADPAVTPPQSAAVETTGTSTLPDPPSLTPTGGAKDYLWIWSGGWEGEQTSPPASNPTNYTLSPIGANSGTAGAVTTNCRVALAARQLNAASENPPSWTISASDDWTALSIAVHPAGPQVDLGSVTANMVFNTPAAEMPVSHTLAATSNMVFGVPAAELPVSHTLEGTSNLVFGVPAPDLTVTASGVALEGNPSNMVFGVPAAGLTVAHTLEGTSNLVFGVPAAAMPVTHPLAAVSNLVFGVPATDLNVSSGVVALAGNPISLTFAASGSVGHLIGNAGQIKMWPTNTPPPGWLILNGSTFSASTYPDLFALLGSTTLPDFRQRFPLGVAAAGTGSTLLGTGGTIDHLHTQPTHVHTSAGHIHAVDPPITTSSAPSATSPTNLIVGADVAADTHTHTVDIPSFNSGSTTPADTGASGGDNTGTANPPFLAIHFIIRAVNTYAPDPTVIVTPIFIEA